MEVLKIVPKPFKCSLTNKTATIDYTYQAVSGTGSDDVSYIFSKRKCQTDRQCALAGLYEKCPLKDTPSE